MPAIPRPDVGVVATVVTMTTRSLSGEESQARFVPVEEFETVMDERDALRRVLSLINVERLDLPAGKPATMRIARLLDSAGMDVALARATASVVADVRQLREGAEALDGRADRPQD